MKPKYVFGIVLLAAFIVFGAISFKKSLTPYVTFAEAMKARGSVQVIGQLVKEKTAYDTTAQVLRFTLADDHGHTLPVTYHGIKPGNFEQAISIVAIGRCEGEAFDADQLLVKCPSKYQGEEVKKYDAR